MEVGVCRLLYLFALLEAGLKHYRRPRARTQAITRHPGLHLASLAHVVTNMYAASGESCMGDAFKVGLAMCIRHVYKNSQGPLKASLAINTMSIQLAIMQLLYRMCFDK